MCICVRDAQIDRQTGRQTETKKANGFAVVQNICNFLGAMLSHNATLPTLQTVLHTHTQALSRTQDALKDSLSSSVCICYCLSLPNLSVSLRLSLSSLSLSASHCFFSLHLQISFSVVLFFPSSPFYSFFFLFYLFLNSTHCVL